MTTATQPIDLTPFCADEAGHYSFVAPWVFKGRRYATDGQIVVRVPAEGEADSPVPDDRPRYPDAAAVLAPLDFGGCSEPWPTGGYVIAKDQSCDDCGGSGVVGRVKCEECGHVSVNGTECQRCGGTGKGIVLVIGNHRICEKHARLIAGLPDVRWRPGVAANLALPFIFGGDGQGAVMSLVKA